jgi:hypothetical protein
MKKTSNIMIFAAIALTTGAAIAYDQTRFIDYHELGISLVNQPHCDEMIEESKINTSAGWAEVVRDACKEDDTRLSAAELAVEQIALRDLKNSKGTMDDTFWGIHRDTVGLTMAMRRIQARMKAEKDAEKRFAKDHPEEWKAKKEKDAADLQAFNKAEQDRQAEVDTAWAKSEQARKDKEAANIAHQKEWDAEQAAYEKDIDQLNQQTRALEQQSRQTMQEASDYVERNRIIQPDTKPADNTAAALAQVEEINDQKVQLIKASQSQASTKPADTEPTP